MATRVFEKLTFGSQGQLKAFLQNCAIVAVHKPVVVLEKLLHCCHGTFLLAFLDRGFFDRAWVVLNDDL